MKVICRKVRDKECDPMDTCSCGEPHEKNHRCQLWCQHRDEWTRECVPVIPEYVRVIRGDFPRWYSDRIGEVFKVEARGEKCYRVYTGSKYDNSTLWWWVREEDCEPREVPRREPFISRGVWHTEKPITGISLGKQKEPCEAVKECNYRRQDVGDLIPRCHLMTLSGDEPHQRESRRMAPACTSKDCPLKKGEIQANLLRGWVEYDDHGELKYRLSPRYGSHEHHVALNVEYQRKLKKGETKMKYKQLKPISLELLWNAQPDKDCHEFLVEWAAFMKMSAGVGWANTWGEMAGIGSRNYSPVRSLCEGTEQYENRTKEMLDFMVRHGFIEKDSEPITVTLQIKDEEDARGLLRDLDESCRGRAYLYYQLLDQLQSQGVNL